MWVQGDLALRDTDGLWYLLGRSDDTIKISGKRTGPAEIESVIMESSLVAEAAVIGIPDTLTGHALVCVCVAAADAPSRDRASTQPFPMQITQTFGAPYRPKRVLLVPELPKTRNQKIMRRLIRAVLSGEPLPQLDALANPDCLDALRTAAQAATAGGNR